MEHLPEQEHMLASINVILLATGLEQANFIIKCPMLLLDRVILDDTVNLWIPPVHSSALLLCCRKQTDQGIFCYIVEGNMLDKKLIL